MEPSWHVAVVVKQDNPKDVANVIDTAVWGTIKSKGGLEELTENLQSNGACCMGPFHNDIAESLRFRMVKIANEHSLYNMSVRVVKMEDTNVQGRMESNANVD